jgi:hypothetical protein
MGPRSWNATVDIIQEELSGRFRGEMAACELLGADLSTHEDDIGDAKTDCHQAEQGRDVRPD